MSTFALNTAATELDLRIELPVQYLETLGWDFEEYHENCAEAKGVSIEEARNYNYNSYVAIIKINGTSDDPKTLVTWYSPSRNEDTMWEATGDDQQTVRDMIELLEEGKLIINSENDYSVDEDDNYVPAFVEVVNDAVNQD